MYANSQMTVSRPSSLSVVNDDEDEVETDAIEVRGFPKNADEEMVTMFLENKRKSGGGPTKEVTFNRTDGTAVVIYNDSNSKFCHFGLIAIYQYQYIRLLVA